MSTSNEEFAFFNNKNNQHHHKVWLAAMNPQEFQRLTRFENCELISIPSICDEIAEKLTENANQLVATECSPDRKAPKIALFLVASQYFIGLIYLHRQQVKFLYDLASSYRIPSTLLIEDQNIVAQTESDDVDVDPSPIFKTKKKALKRKSSTKVQKTLKRKISLVLHTSDENDDIEGQNLKTMELLQSSFVAKNVDISIREHIPLNNESNEAINSFGMQEDNSVPERIGNTSLEDVMMSMTLDQSQDVIDFVPTNLMESTRQANDTVYGDARNTEILLTVSEEGAGCELGLENCLSSSGDAIEMEILAPTDSINSTRKRKRTRRSPPLKDITLSVNVEENVKTVSTTQRHLHPKDDSVSKAACLSNLSRKVFVEPSHTSFTESMTRQFESRSMSAKLVQSFQRMTLTKTEKTNREMVQEFCSNLQEDDQPVISMSPVENHVAFVPRQRSDSSLPFVELTFDGCNSQTINEQSIEEQTSAPLNVVPPIYDDLTPFTAEAFIYEHVPVELPPSIRQMLINNETVDPVTQCDTDSQKLFASRSRQNKSDWGKEGVLRKLMSLWNSGVDPIGMKEIMQSNKQRISAATAFFSVMELNSTRIGLITLTKCADSNVIFNITKSPKLIELHESV